MGRYRDTFSFVLSTISGIQGKRWGLKMEIAAQSISEGSHKGLAHTLWMSVNYNILNVSLVCPWHTKAKTGNDKALVNHYSWARPATVKQIGKWTQIFKLGKYPIFWSDLRQWKSCCSTPLLNKHLSWLRHPCQGHCWELRFWTRCQGISLKTWNFKAIAADSMSWKPPRPKRKKIMTKLQ